MNIKIIEGVFSSTSKTYRSKNGKHLFKFNFTNNGNHIDIFCPSHPSLNGRDSDPRKTHIFSSKRLCFFKEREPKNQSRAENLACQWAEYFLEYRRTGKPQN